jgi:hypothetical protein
MVNIKNATANNPFHREQVIRKVDMTSFSQKKDSIDSGISNKEVSVISNIKDDGVETERSALNLIVGG